MKRSVVVLLTLVLFAGATQALATGLITKAQAEKDALNAVGGGTVVSAVLERNAGHKTWSVDINGASNEYEVWVDAHTGTILKVITQPLSATNGLITKAQAEAEALKAVAGGTVLQTVLESNLDKKTWSVDISEPAAEHEVWVEAHTGAILKIVTQPAGALACTYISKKTAEKDALKAVGGGTVISARLETNDHPVIWSVDVQANNGKEYEVQVNACNGKIVAIIPGG